MDVEFVKSPSERPDGASEGGIARLDRAAAAVVRLQQTFAVLQARIAKPQAPDLVLARMSALLSAASVARPGTAEFVAAGARAELLGRVGSLRLPSIPAHPAASVVLLADDAEAAIAVLRGMVALLVAEPMELLVAACSGAPEIAMLAAVVSNLRVIGATSDQDQVINVAVSASHAERVILLDAAPDAWAAPQAQDVWVGQAVLDRLGQFGVRLPESSHVDAGLHMAMPRALWDAAGGLDATMADGQGLELADMCLKLRLLGARLVAVPGRSRWRGNPSARRAPDIAMAAFRERWGDLRMEATPAA
jgi:hypothetical protein